MNEPVNFIAKFGISRKLVTVWELHEIFDLVVNAFKCQRNFPSNFKLQFMHKDVNELIDLDSPIQFYDWVNNELLIIPANTVVTSDEDEPDLSDHFMYVFCIYLVFIFNPFSLKSDIIFASQSAFKDMLTFLAPIPQNGQTHSNKLFKRL